MNTYTIWIGNAVMAIGAAIIVCSLATCAAWLVNYAVRQLLECYGGWKVFMEYREWYLKNKKGGAA
jgi:uncharacterized membrane protein (DUF2068 family)